MLKPLIYVLLFVAVVVFVQTLSGVFFKKADRDRRINRRMAMIEAGKSSEDVLAELVRKMPAHDAKLASLAGLQRHLEIQLMQAGLSYSPMQLLGIVAAATGALWLVTLAFAALQGGNLIVNVFLAFAGSAIIAATAVTVWMSSRRASRIKKIEEQLPVALDIINRAIKAGHPVISALQLGASEVGDPLGSQLGIVVDETTYGVEFKQALVNMAYRTGSRDVHFFAVSVGIQSDTGGNLVEILQGLASVVRGRQTLGKRVKSLASEGQASGLILSVLPLLLIGFQLCVHPRVYTDKFSDPIFWPVVIVTGIVYVAGWLMVRRIINFRY